MYNTIVETHMISLVNKNHPLDDDYKPNDLIPLNTIKGNIFSLRYDDELLDRKTAYSFLKMAKSAKKAGFNKLLIASGYRTKEVQAYLYNKNSLYTLKPRCSEHETGLAIDIGKDENNINKNGQTDKKWLRYNSYKYGFILRYPRGKEKITGIPYESWHFRYVGKIASNIIYKNDLTLEEYCEKIDKKFIITKLFLYIKSIMIKKVNKKET